MGHMRMAFRLFLVVCVAVVVGCVYYNTFFNAKRAFEEAERGRLRRQELQEQMRQRRGSSSRTSSASSNTRSTSPARPGVTPNADLYRTAIEKAAKVIAYYPESKYVDDALLLMAKAYFRLNEFGRSLRKCDELLTSFPQSELAPEARYWRGMALWQLGEREEAARALRRIADTQGSPFRGDAAFALAELEREEGDLEAAIEHYRVAVKNAKDPAFRADARKSLGESLIEAHRPEEAVPVFRALAAAARTSRDRYEALVKMATAQRQMGNYAEALATLEPLLHDEHFDEFVLRTKLELARTYEEQGAVASAVLLYQSIIEQEEREHSAQLQGQSPQGTSTSQATRPPRSLPPEVAEAHYRLGLIQERTYHNLAAAGEHYAAAQNSRGEIGTLAQRRKQDIDRWKELHEALADTSDSTKIRQRPITVFSLGEHFYFALDNADSALAYFQMLVDRFPHSPLRPRAQYAIGWLLMHVRGDTLRADSVWNALLADTTRTREVRQLQRAIMEQRGLQPRDPAQEPFERAERAWLRALDERPPEPPDSLMRDSLALARWWQEWAQEHEQRSEAYRPLLERVVERYPESPYAARARFILGWLAENVEGDTAAALQWYRQASEDTLAAPAVANIARELVSLRTQRAQAPPDSLERARAPSSVPSEMQSAEADSTADGEASPGRLSPREFPNENR